MRWFARLLGLATSMLGACSLTSSLDSLSENSGSGGTSNDGGGSGGTDGGNPSCGPGHKPCSSSCVSVNDPATGCGGPSCDPCSPANAEPLCVTGACALGQCANGHEDCNGDASDGCETNLKSSSESCGACFVSCLLPHQQVSCLAGSCQVGDCEQGYAECDGNLTNGCETNTGADPTNCGACANVCIAPSGKSAICDAGQCGISNCAPPLADCDKDSAATCETDTSSASADCGFCGGKCEYPNGVPKCAASTCALDGCQNGWGNCDANLANGCETNTSASLSNCGTCANVCSGGAHGQPACASGSCGLKCDAGWGNCDGAVSSGCEAPLDTNANCGACGTVVSASGSAPTGSVSASGNTITVTNCGPEDCNQYPITLTGVTASGSAPQGSSITASGNTITFTKCVDGDCTDYPITLIGATASGSAPPGSSVTASGNTITFTKCSDGDCTDYPIALTCAP